LLAKVTVVKIAIYGTLVCGDVAVYICSHITTHQCMQARVMRSLTMVRLRRNMSELF
jgi:hypothetical protein